MDNKLYTKSIDLFQDVPIDETNLIVEPFANSEKIINKNDITYITKKGIIKAGSDDNIFKTPSNIENIKSLSQEKPQEKPIIIKPIIDNSLELKQPLEKPLEKPKPNPDIFVKNIEKSINIEIPKEEVKVKSLENIKVEESNHNETLCEDDILEKKLNLLNLIGEISENTGMKVPNYSIHSKLEEMERSYKLLNKMKSKKDMVSFCCNTLTFGLVAFEKVNSVKKLLPIDTKGNLSKNISNNMPKFKEAFGDLYEKYFSSNESKMGPELKLVFALLSTVGITIISSVFSGNDDPKKTLLDNPEILENIVNKEKDDSIPELDKDKIRLMNEIKRYKDNKEDLSFIKDAMAEDTVYSNNISNVSKIDMFKKKLNQLKKNSNMNN